jgi:arylmalonate decarboxylase
MIPDSRRGFLKTTAAGIVSAAPGLASEPVLGLMFPPATWPLPREAHALYPTGVRFVVAGIGIGRTMPEGFDHVIEFIVPAAKKLAKDGAAAIVLMGAPLSFYKGAAFNQRLAGEIKNATGLPSVTMSTAMVEGLKTLRARRVAVATAYTTEISLHLQAFLEQHGFEVLAVKGLGVEQFEDRAPVTEVVTGGELMEFCVKIRESRPEADALLIASGYLPTLEIIEPVEKRCQIPVVASTPHALRAGVRLLGLGGRAPGFGTLLES